MNEDLKRAMGDLLSTAYCRGLAAGSGTQVFKDSRVYTSEELRELYQAQEKEVVALMENLVVTR